MQVLLIVIFLLDFLLFQLKKFCHLKLLNLLIKDILITSQLRTALILNKNIKATNYQIDTYKEKIYLYGIALTIAEKDMVISEAKEIPDVDDVIASIILVEDLRIQKD